MTTRNQLNHKSQEKTNNFNEEACTRMKQSLVSETELRRIGSADHTVYRMEKPRNG